MKQSSNHYFVLIICFLLTCIFSYGQNAPVANDDYLNSCYSLNPLANDYDADGNNTISIDTNWIKAPSFGRASIYSYNGRLIYQLYEQHLSSNILDTITYRICDTGFPVQCDTASIFIQMTAADFPSIDSVMHSSSVCGNEGTATIHHQQTYWNYYTFTLESTTSNSVVNSTYLLGHFTDLAADTYSPVVQNSFYSCGLILSPITISSNPNAPIINSVIESDFVNGDLDTITINATGNNLEYSINGGYTWQSSSVFNNLHKGSYNVKVRSGQNCVTTHSNNPVILSHTGNNISIIDITSVTFTHPTNCDSTDGSIHITTGSPFNFYSLDSGMTWYQNSTSPHTGLAAGTYNILGSDDLMMSTVVYAEPIILEAQTASTIDSVSYVEPSNGMNNGQMTIHATPQMSKTIEYSIDGGLHWQNFKDFLGLMGGTYTPCVRYVDSTCQVCHPSVVLSGANNNPPVAVDDYYTSLMDSIVVGNVLTNDSDPDGNTLTVNTTPLISPSNGTLTINPDGSFAYVPNPGFTGTDSCVYILCDDGTPSLCDTAFFYIYVVSNPIYNNVAYTIPSACDVDDGSITISAVAPNPLQYSIDGGYSWYNTPNFIGLPNGAYNVVIKEVNSTVFYHYANNPVNVTHPNAPYFTDVTSTQPTSCSVYNGTINLQAGGSIGSYEYTIDGGSTWQASNIFQGLAGGVYLVCVRASFGACVVRYNQPVVLTEGGGYHFTISRILATDCNSYDGQIILNTTTDTGVVVEYSIDNGLNWQTNNVFSGLSAGNYTILHRNANTLAVCSGSNPFQVELEAVNQPTIQNVTTSQPTGCTSDGSITIHATADSALVYSIDGGATWQIDSIFNNLTNGSYEIAVKYPNGCVTDYHYPIILNNPLSPIIYHIWTENGCGVNQGKLWGNSSYFNFEVSIDSGQTWSAQTNSTFLFDNLPSGTYHVRIRLVGGTCETLYPTPIIIENPQGVQISNIIANDVSACGQIDGNITILTNGATNAHYSINNGINWQRDSVFTHLNLSNYQIIVRDSTGECLDTAATPTIISNTSAPTITNVTSITPNECGFNNGSITVTASGSQGLEYSLDSVHWQTNDQFSNLFAGSYMIFVRNADSTCAVRYSPNIHLEEKHTPIFNQVSANSPTNCSSNNGYIYISAWSSLPYSSGTTLEFSIDGGTNWQSSNQFSGLTCGNYLIQVRYSDGTCTTTYGNVTFSDNQAPKAINDSFQTTVNVPVTGDVLVNDTDPNGDVLIVNTTPVYTSLSGGAVILASNGGFTYFPYGGFSGVDSFQYQICDNGNPTLCDTGTVFINVVSWTTDIIYMNVNANTALNTCVDTSELSGTLTGLTNVNTHALNFGTLSFYGVHCISYVASGFSGTDTITVIASDNLNGHDTTIFIINVIGSNTAPVAVDDYYTTSLNTAVSGNILVNDYDIDNNTLIVSTTPVITPPNGTIGINTDGTITYTPNSAFIGLDSFQYQVCDDGIPSLCDTATVYINLVPFTTDTIYSNVNPNATLSICVDTTELSGIFQGLTNLNSHVLLYGTVVLNSQCISYTAGASMGTDTITVLAYDNLGGQDTTIFLITINASQTPLQIVNISGADESCSQGNGYLDILANGGTGMYEYSIDNQQTWQSNSHFGNLSAGVYQAFVRDGQDTAAYIFNPIVLHDTLAPIIVSANYSYDTLVILANANQPMQYSIDCGATWHNTNIFYPVSSGNLCIGVRLFSGSCPVFVNITFSNNPPVAVADTVTFAQSGYQTLNVITNDYDLENNLFYAVPQTNYYGSDSLTLDSNGVMTVPTDAWNFGSYMISYQICEVYNPTNCSQSAAYITIAPPPQTYSDTMAIGATYTLCLPNNLPGVPITGTLISGFTNNIIDSVVANCLYIYGDNYGIDTAIVQLCDNFGFCDTTHVYLNVIDGVWPGDTDDDTYVDNYDLLNIGLGYGTIGTQRNSITNNWNGYITPFWNVATPLTNIDYRHADCNGDGMVNSLDTVAILQNYGLAYQRGGTSVLGGIPIQIGIDTASKFPKYCLPILFGDAANPVVGLYGGAFSIAYDTTLIKVDSIYITWDTTWVGTNNVDMIAIQKNLPNNSQLDIAFTRIDGNNVNGFGIIGKLNFTIKDDILRPNISSDSIWAQFHIFDTKFISNDESPIGVDELSTNFLITSINKVEPQINHLVSVFPNPAKDFVNISTENLNVEHITISDMSGRTMHFENGNHSSLQRINIKSLPSGVYNIQLQTNKGIAVQRLTVLK